jgi:DNA-binding CsgD family transcriptional regulator
MGSPQKAPSPTTSWYALAVAAFHKADFSAAAQLLDEAETVRKTSFNATAALLRARISLKNDAAAALEYLTRRSSLFTNSAAQAESIMLQGVAYARLGDARSASSRFKEAASFCPPSTDLALEIVYQRAAALWIERKLDQAERVLAPVEPVATGTLAIEIRVLRGAIQAARGNISQQAAILIEALRLVHATPDPSTLHWAIVASQIAYLARELPSATLRTDAHRELPKIPWTNDLTELRYRMLRAVAWCHALEGDDFNAFRRLKEAAAVTPSAAWRVMSFCDRAYLATALAEPRWAEQELRDAHELASTITWSALDGEERFALLLLAELYAPRDSALALSYVAQYRSNTGRYNRTLSSSNDRRVGAMEAYSTGVVQRAIGDLSEAIRLFREAWTVSDAIGYDWRAGRTALALAELTGDAGWRERAKEKLREYPRSWLVTGERRSTLSESSQLALLTPAQRAVFDLLIAGMPIKEIAAAQQRAEYTVRNHVKAIFKAFNVTSRAALMAWANKKL